MTCVVVAVTLCPLHRPDLIPFLGALVGSQGRSSVTVHQLPLIFQTSEIVCGGSVQWQSHNLPSWDPASESTGGENEGTAVQMAVACSAPALLRSGHEHMSA
jgi:hypothetical protein